MRLSNAEIETAFGFIGFTPALLPRLDDGQTHQMRCSHCGGRVTVFSRRDVDIATQREQTLREAMENARTPRGRAYWAVLLHDFTVWGGAWAQHKHANPECDLSQEHEAVENALRQQREPGLVQQTIVDAIARERFILTEVRIDGRSIDIVDPGAKLKLEVVVSGWDTAERVAWLASQGGKYLIAGTQNVDYMRGPGVVARDGYSSKEARRAYRDYRRFNREPEALRTMQAACAFENRMRAGAALKSVTLGKRLNSLFVLQDGVTGEIATGLDEGGALVVATGLPSGYHRAAARIC